MIFQDEYGNKFTWSVHCTPKPVENKKTKCIHCNGSGRLPDSLGWHYDTKSCDWCFGSGEQDVKICCYDKDLEKYLEKFIDQFYKDRETSFLGENI